MLVCDDKVVHEDFKFLGNESNRYLLELKRVCLLNKIDHHLIRTYARRIYYCYSMYDNFFYVTLLQILFELYQLV